MSQLTLSHITKRDHEKNLLDNLSLTIEEKSLYILLGPSGSGKTLLFKIIEGVVQQTLGEIFLDNVDMTNVNPRERDIGIAFQSLILYGTRTVYDNLEATLKYRKVPHKYHRALIFETLELLDIGKYAKEKISQLTLETRRKVELAHGIVGKPKMLLVDGIFTDMEMNQRRHMKDKLLEIQRILDIPIIYGTNEPVEAMTYNSPIFVLNEGKILQEGFPSDLYLNPHNLFVADYIGYPPANIIKQPDGYYAIHVEDVIINPDQAIPGLKLVGTIYMQEHYGDETLHVVKTPLGDMKAMALNYWEHMQGPVEIVLPTTRLYHFDENGQRLDH